METQEILKELKKSQDEYLQTWGEFKKTNDERVERIEKGLGGVAELDQKLAKMEKTLQAQEELKGKLEQLENAIARGAEAGKGISAKDLEAKANFLEAYKKGFNGEAKAMVSTVGEDGGFAVPEAMISEIDSIVYETSPMRSICSVVTTGTDAYKGLIIDTEVGSGWEGHTENNGETSTFKIQKYQIPVHRLTARPEINVDTLEDAMFDLEGELKMQVSDKFARDENYAFVLGDGEGKPEGFLSLSEAADPEVYERGAIGTLQTAASSTLAYNDVMSLIYGLKGQYRMNARIGGSRLVFSAIRKLAGSNGQYLWDPNVRVGQPSTILGVPTVELNDMSDAVTTGGAKVLAIADWKRAYKIVDRAGLYTLIDPYTKEPNVKYVFRKRVGGQCVNTDAIKVLKIKA